MVTVHAQEIVINRAHGCSTMAGSWQCAQLIAPLIALLIALLIVLKAGSACLCAVAHTIQQPAADATVVRWPFCFQVRQLFGRCDVSRGLNTCDGEHNQQRQDSRSIKSCAQSVF